MTSTGNADVVTVLLLMLREGSSKRTAQADLKAIREFVGKVKGQLVTVADFAKKRGYTMAQARRALDLPPKKKKNKE